MLSHLFNRSYNFQVIFFVSFLCYIFIYAITHHHSLFILTIKYLKKRYFVKARPLMTSKKTLIDFISADKGFNRLILFGLFIYFIINLMSLMAFPLVHSDEIWLKGLSLEVWQSKAFGLTEPFYDLYPRVPHPFRWAFNLLQIGTMGLLGNSIFSVRVVSLVASTCGLYVFAKLIAHQTK